MADKTPIPGSRLQGVFSKKKKTDESRVMSHELQTHESHSHESEDTKVMNHESHSHENEIKDAQSHDSGVTNHESDNHDSGNMIHESGTPGIDPKVLEWAIAKGRDDPRISGYSEFAMSMLRYLRKTTPEFSMSGAASELLEEALRAKYPDLSKAMTEKMGKAQ